MSITPPRRVRSHSVCAIAVLAVIAVVTSIGPRLAASSPLTPGNLVIYRVGAGATSLVNTGNEVFLDEYRTSGMLVQSIPLPTTTTATNHRLIASGTATSEGMMTRSADGLYLVLSGYDAAIPTTGLAGTAGTATPRVVGRVNVAGDIDTSTAITDWASGNNPRSAASSDGVNFWVGGGAGGVRYATLGSATSTQLSTTVTNIRGVEIFDGQLYNSDSSGTAVRIGVVGTGLPTTSNQTIMNLPGVPSSAGSPYAFLLADLDANVAGVDTLYVADDSAGLIKYSLVGGTWTANGTVGTAADAYRGLTGVVGGTSVTLFATRKGGSGATGGGELVMLADASGYNGAFSGSPLVLATASANTAFRGVALAPAAVAIGAQPSDATISVGTGTTLTVAATGPGTLSYQWYAGARGDTSDPIVGETGSSFTTPQLFATSTYWVRVSNSFGSVDSRTATVTVQSSVAPTIVQQPASQTISPGTTATLSVQANGTTPFTFQWYLGASGDTTAKIDGATSDMFTTPSLLQTTSYWVRVGNDAGFVNSQTATIAVPAPVCSSPHIAINAVQGSGETSPYAGQSVTVRGVVVGDDEGPSPALRGFYMQDLASDDDQNPLTSEGIFVFEGSNADTVSDGQVVQVTGAVSEFQGQTQITASSIEQCGTTSSVTPTDVMLPVAAAANGVDYLERFEGMLVRFHQTLYVTEHFQLGRFGQVVMSSSGRLPQPTSIVLPGVAAQVQQAANDRNRIIVDDELNNQNPDPIRFGRVGNPLSALNTVRGGDTATDVVGVMTYTWAGNAASGNAYRLRPVGALGGGVPNFQPSNPRPSGAPSVGGTLKIVGMNVLNYFLTLDTGGSPCGPIGHKQACRGAETASELARQQAKLNAALVKLNADIIGMSELENTQNDTGADVNPLADIVNRLNATLGSSVYTYIDTGIQGTDAIRVGLVYKPSRVTPIGGFLVDNNPVHNRPPLAQLFSDNVTGERFSLVVNHFKSKGCGSSPNPLDADQNDGQSCFNATRVQQAQALVSFINTAVLPAANDPDVLLVGDFNSYAKEDPIRTIEQAGFTNLVSRFSGAHAYSYLFDGEWGYLDHALASATLLPQVTGAGDYHINADEPSVLDYNENFKSAGQLSSLYNIDEFRISDHDPVAIGLTPRAAPQATADTYSIESGTTLSVNSAGGVLSNDSIGPLSIFSYTSPTHGTLTMNPDGAFVYAPQAGYIGADSFTYTASDAVRRYNMLLYSTNLTSLGTFGGVGLTAGDFGSSLYPVPGTPGAFYGLTDRGPNVDGPNGSRVEPLPSFAPMVGRFTLAAGGQAHLDSTITLRAPDGTPYSGRVNSQADTGETILDLNGSVLPSDPNGYDPEGLVALADGTFWVSDEYGPFITHFDATGKQVGRLSPFDGTLPMELAKRIPNRGMEGLTLTPDGTTLVGMMQSALQQDDLAGFDAKKLTPLRIVTSRLADGATHEYLYLLDHPATTKTAVSEIAALSNTLFLVIERDGDYLPTSYKKLFLIDITGATDVGPASAVPGAAYDPAHGGLQISGKTIERLLQNLNTASSLTALAANDITPVSKALYVDVAASVAGVDPTGHFFAHDKLEGLSIVNAGGTLVISNDSDFGISGLTNSAPPFTLAAKITPAGIPDDGEFLVMDLIRSTTTVTLNTADTIAPQTSLDSMPMSPTRSTSASFSFGGSDAGSGIASFDCRLDAGAFATCGGTTISYSSLAEGVHTFAVRAIDKAGNVDASPSSFAWTIDVTAPVLTVPAKTIVEATGPTGAVVTLTLPTTAPDAVDGSDAVSCGGGTSGAMFPLGTTTITCSSTDHAGNTAVKSFTVTVRDTTAPTILSATPSVTKLWPPNRANVPVTIAVSAHDLVTASSTCQIVLVSSNQPGGNQWTITGPLTLSLVADRAGASDRIYTIQVTCADAAGNTSPGASATVTVKNK